MNSQNKPVSQLMLDLARSVGRLAQQEARLLREESSEHAAQATLGLIGVVAGMLVALASLLVLVQALIVALAEYMPAELAALITGIGLAIVAFLLVRGGQALLRPSALTLPKTVESLKRDKDMVMETVR